MPFLRHIRKFICEPGQALKTEPRDTSPLMERAMPKDEPDISRTLNRAANALEHIACSLVAIEMLQGAQEGGVYDDVLIPHRRFHHENCAACGNETQNAADLEKKFQSEVFERPLATFDSSNRARSGR